MADPIVECTMLMFHGMDNDLNYHCPGGWNGSWSGALLTITRRDMIARVSLSDAGYHDHFDKVLVRFTSQSNLGCYEDVVMSFKECGLIVPESDSIYEPCVSRNMGGWSRECDTKPVYQAVLHLVLITMGN